MLDCMAEGIEYTVCGVDRNPGLENLLTADQWAAVKTRYNGNEGMARTATSAMAVALLKQPFCDFLLDHVVQARAAYPQGVRMQAYNGPELDGFDPWNMYDEEYRQFWRDIGVDVPHGGANPVALNDLIRNNYDSYANQVKAIWGSPWLGKTTHMYEYIGSWGQRMYVAPGPDSMQEPIITEWGAHRFECNNLVNVFQTLPIRMIEHNAQKGVQVTDATGTYNVLEAFLHEPLDSRFIDLWQQGRTQLLWNSRQYSALVLSMTDNRHGWVPWSGVFMDAPVATAIQETMRSLSGAGGSSQPGNGRRGGSTGRRNLNVWTSDHVNERRAA